MGSNPTLVEVGKNKNKRKRKRRKTEKLPENTARHDSVEENGSAEQTAIPQTENSINQRVNDEDPNASNPTRSNVIIAGDSMVKHLDGFKMSKTDTRVKVSTFPGCTTLDMADYIKPILRKNP